MKVVILCGGMGTRLREETEFRSYRVWQTDFALQFGSPEQPCFHQGDDPVN